MTWKGYSDRVNCKIKNVQNLGVVEKKADVREAILGKKSIAQSTNASTIKGQRLHISKEMLGE